MDFYDGIVGSGGEADRVRDEYEESVTYRVGNVLMTGPRKVRDAISRFVYEQTKRSPMILPIIMEV